MIDINIKGVVNGAYAALPYLKVTPNSRLINIASCASLYGTPRLAVYSATKFAVRGLSEALDIEFGRHDIAVSCVMPWFIDTPLLDDAGGGANEHLRDTVLAAKQKNLYHAGGRRDHLASRGWHKTAPHRRRRGEELWADGASFAGARAAQPAARAGGCVKGSGSVLKKRTMRPLLF